MIYKITYGCYLNMETEFVKTNASEDEMSQLVRELAYAETEGWTEHFVDEDENEVIDLHLAIDDHTEYSVELFDHSMVEELEEYGLTDY